MSSVSSAPVGQITFVISFPDEPGIAKLRSLLRAAIATG
jgi:hypothetical protein